jgi:putative hydrolase
MIEIDTHVHTVLSGHAYSTVSENVRCAKENGLKGFCVTDHGPDFVNGAPDFVAYSMQTWPKYMEGIRIYKSCEANIIDEFGNLDYDQIYIDMLDFVSAGIHTVDPAYMDYNNTTKAYIAFYNNVYNDVATHIDQGRYPCDLEAVMKVAKANDKPIEINNSSYLLRPGSDKTIQMMIDFCKQTDTKIVVASDAHLCYSIADISAVTPYLNAVNFPKELIVNATLESFEAYIKQRLKRIQAYVKQYD